jgi:hypothetical protein
MTDDQREALEMFSEALDIAIEVGQVVTVRVPRGLPGGGKRFGELRRPEVLTLAELFEEARRDMERMVGLLKTLQRTAFE